MSSQPCSIWKIDWGICSFFKGPFVIDTSNIFGGGSEVVREYFHVLPRNLAYMYRMISSGVSALVSGSLGVFLLVQWCFFLEALPYASVSYDEWVSIILGVTALLRLGESYPCLLSPSYTDGEVLNGILILLKVTNFLEVSLNFSGELLCDCKLRPGKPASFLLVSLSQDGEGINIIFYFSLMIFF